MSYRGTDNVHVYTPFLRTQLHRVSHLKPVTVKEIEELLAPFSAPHLQPAVRNILNSVKEERDSPEDTLKGTIRDPDLGGYDCAPLIKELAPLGELFEITLQEIGVTCRQGISHRLLWLYLTVVSSDGEECNQAP